MEDVPHRKLFSLGAIGVSNPTSRVREIVSRMAQLDIWSKEKPICTLWLRKRHSDTPRVYNSHAADHAAKLHVGMAADDQRHIDPSEDREEAVFRRQAGKDLSVASRRRVAEQHVTQPVNLDLICCWPTRQPRLVSRSKLLCRPAYDLSVSFWNLAEIPARHLRKQTALAIAADESNWYIEVGQTCECLSRHRAGHHIPTDHDLVDLGRASVLEDGLQCREVGMDVIQRSNPHGKPKIILEAAAAVAANVDRDDRPVLLTAR